MLQKLSLLDSDDYGRLIVVKHSIEMLSNYISGRSHPQEIRAESDCIETWDDMVIINSSTEKHHYQIKKQDTKFCDHDIDRNAFLKNSNSKKKNLYFSALDKTIKQLGEQILTHVGHTKKYFIVTPGNNILIKKDLELRILEDLCNHTSDKTSSLDKFELDVIDSSKDTQKIVSWLTSWCGFTNVEHIFKALTVLNILRPGNFQYIKNNCISDLSSYFLLPEDVYSIIYEYAFPNSTHSNGITPEALFQKVKHLLRPDVSLWTRYAKTDSGWEKSGINHSTNDETEPASKVVSSLWSSDNTEKKLIIDETAQKATGNDKLINGLNRLAIHLQGTKRIEVNNPDDFTNKIKHSCGHTLGISTSDFENLQIRTLNDGGSNSIKKCFSTRDELQRESEELTNQMYAEVWAEIKSKVNSQIQNSDDIDCEEILDAIEGRWNFWLENLDQNNNYKLFLKSMMKMRLEDGINEELRIGTKTINLLVEAIILSLLVSCGLSEGNCNWDEFQSKTIGVKALKFWYNRNNSKIRQVGSNNDSLSMIGYEPTAILILSGTDSSGSVIEEKRLGSSSSRTFYLGESKQPMMLITKQIINDHCESLEDLRNHIQTQFQVYDNSINGLLDQASKLKS